MSYVFHTTWRFDHDADAVFAALADVAAYPSWWPQVRAARQLDDGVGELRCRSLLPYDLTFVMHREVEDAGHRVLVARLEGDLTGTSRWTVTADGAGLQQRSSTRTSRSARALCAPPAGSPGPRCGSTTT